MEKLKCFSLVSLNTSYSFPSFDRDISFVWKECLEQGSSMEGRQYNLHIILKKNPVKQKQ